MSGEPHLVPMVNQHIERRLAHIEDAEEIRKQFFRMKLDETSALNFLNGVGVWSAIEDHQVTTRSDGTLRSGNASVGIKEMLLMGAFGHRYFAGRALPVTVEELGREQNYWRSLKRSPAKLRTAFGPSPSGDSAPHIKDTFAINSRFGNTLQVHLEWKGKHPRAIIQPITGRELLIALAWIDLVTDADCKVCHNHKCGIEYTRGGRKFCTWQCEHANTTRTYRINRGKREAAKRKARKSLR
jgi:hypothetical protein